MIDPTQTADQPRRRLRPPFSDVPGLVDVTAEDATAIVRTFNAYSEAQAAFSRRLAAATSLNVGGGRPQTAKVIADVRELFGVVREDRTEAGRSKGIEKRVAIIKMWRNWSRQLTLRKIDPATFVRAVFSSWPINRGMPFPAMIFTANNLERYASLVHASDDAIRAQHVFDQKKFIAETYFRSETNRGEDRQANWVAVLTDDRNGISSIYRVCVASSIQAAKDVPPDVRGRLDAVVARHVGAAREQYAARPETYDAVFINKVPAFLKVADVTPTGEEPVQ